MRGVVAGRHGQTTLFFAIGLVLLIAIAIIFLTLNRSTSTQAPETVDIAKSRVLNQYVSSCIDTVMDDELMSLGKTGGISLTETAHPAGYPYGTVHLNGEDVRVIYGVTRNRRQLGDIIPPAVAVKPPVNGPVNYYGINRSTAEWYKSDRGSNPDSSDGLFPLPEFSDGYFGQLNFPPVCSKDGPNSQDSNTPCKYYIGTPSGIGTGSKDLQDMLVDKVRGRIQQCVDLRQFREAVGSDVTNVTAPDVTVKFTRSNVLVTLVYNLTLQGRAQVSTVPFDRRYDVRYLPIIEYAIALGRMESRDITFDIATDYKDTDRLPYLEGFTVNRTSLDVADRNVGGIADFSPHADLVTITDSLSKIQGQNYRLNFLIEHRKPMLEPIMALPPPPPPSRIIVANDPSSDPQWLAAADIVSSLAQDELYDPNANMATDYPTTTGGMSVSLTVGGSTSTSSDQFHAVTITVDGKSYTFDVQDLPPPSNAVLWEPPHAFDPDAGELIIPPPIRLDPQKLIYKFTATDADGDTDWEIVDFTPPPTPPPPVPAAGSGTCHGTNWEDFGSGCAITIT